MGGTPKSCELATRSGRNSRKWCRARDCSIRYSRIANNRTSTFRVVEHPPYPRKKVCVRNTQGMSQHRGCLPLSISNITLCLTHTHKKGPLANIRRRCSPGAARKISLIPCTLHTHTILVVRRRLNEDAPLPHYPLTARCRPRIMGRMRIRNVVLAGIAVGAVLFACSGCYSIEQSAPLDVTRFNVPEGRAIVVKVDPAPLTPWAASQEAWVVNLDGKVLVQPVQTPAGGQNWLGALSTNANAALADMPADAALVGSLIAK